MLRPRNFCHRPADRKTGRNSNQANSTFQTAAQTHGYPLSTLTDNGMVYTTRLAQGGRQAGLNAFETLLKLEGITQKNGRPYKPTTQGKIERFWQTLKKYLTQHPARTIPELQRVLDEFVTFYEYSVF